MIGLMSVGLVLCIYGLSALRLMGSRQEQHTAVESAALAAARDLSRIFVEDKHFGYIGLVDYAPKGTGVAASDGYGLPVRSINTVLATIRLDMLIAQQLNNSDMLQMAIADYGYAMAAKDKLNAALALATTTGAPNYTDVDGNTFNAYEDALAAYQKNVIRMAGSSEITQDSLELQLGINTQGLTTTPAPSPANLASIGKADQANGMYVASRDVPVKRYDFVFSGTDTITTLIDASNFTTIEKSNLPYAVPSVVQARAVQTFNKTAAGTVQISDQACAQAGGPQWNCPAPGSLVIGFPDGCPSEISTISSILQSPAITASPATFYGVNGDFPLAPSSLRVQQQVNYPLDSLPSTKSAIELGLYCWLKHLGPAVNIQSVINTFGSILIPPGIVPRTELFSGSSYPGNWKNEYIDDPSGPMVGSTPCQLGLMAAYNLNPASGTIKQSVLVEDWIYIPNSDSQLFALSDQSFSALSTVRSYDVAVSINDYQYGATAGGAHGGEPIVDNRLSQNTPYTNGFVPTPLIMPPLAGLPGEGLGWDGRAGGWAYRRWKQLPVCTADVTEPYLIAQPTAEGLGGPQGTTGAIRPTYQQNGLSVDIEFHKIVTTYYSCWGGWSAFALEHIHNKYH